MGDCRAPAREEPPPPPPKALALDPVEAETVFADIAAAWNSTCGQFGIDRLSAPEDWSQERRERAWWLWVKAAKRRPEKIRAVFEYAVSCPRLIGKSPPGKGFQEMCIRDRVETSALVDFQTRVLVDRQTRMLV